MAEITEQHFDDASAPVNDDPVRLLFVAGAEVLTDAATYVAVAFVDGTATRAAVPRRTSEEAQRDADAFAADADDGQAFIVHRQDERLHMLWPREGGRVRVWNGRL